MTLSSVISGIIGGAIGILPSLLFVLLFFYPNPSVAATSTVSPLPKKTPESILRRFYLGEAFKWILTVFLFFLAFQWKDLQPLPLFLVFIATQLLYWIIPFVKSLDLKHRS